MILTWLLPESITRPRIKSYLERRLEFLESVIDDVENGHSLHHSYLRHNYPALKNSQVEALFQLAFTQGIPLLPALGELVRETKFLIEQERELDIEIAPARATLTLLTYFPALILLGALLTKIIKLNQIFFQPIPVLMIVTSILLQGLGRRWSKSIISSVRE